MNHVVSLLSSIALGGLLEKANDSIYRILDANCNRLREALRVIEEYCRFIMNDASASTELKLLRHKLVTIEEQLGYQKLLAHRDAQHDPFADKNRPEEMVRATNSTILTANCKRAQEAARVIEEYAKRTAVPAVSEIAKIIRFTLYTLEQQLSI